MACNRVAGSSVPAEQCEVRVQLFQYMFAYAQAILSPKNHDSPVENCHKSMKPVPTHECLEELVYVCTKPAKRSLRRCCTGRHFTILRQLNIHVPAAFLTSSWLVVVVQLCPHRFCDFESSVYDINGIHNAR
jgi:hypothetical protein